MQSAVSKRVLSTLASKIHPQLPLSPRESQQLLSLLTSSFRAHLDREHPLSAPDASQPRPARRPSTSNGQAGSSSSRATSSYASATRHIDSILTNPLFAVKPHRRGSDSAAVHVLRDPMTWFVNEIAAGTATLPKAAMCLDVLEKSAKPTPSMPLDGKSSAGTIVEWLRSSGLDTSKQFLDMCVGSGQGTIFLHKLVTLLLAEGETDALWRWFARSSYQRVKDTGLDISKAASFRQQLLLRMVSIKANTDLHRGLATFMQAFRLIEDAGNKPAFKLMRPSGGHLVDRIVSSTGHTLEPELYQSFLLSSRHWLEDWHQAVESMLWLHHPSESSPFPGLRLIRDPAGAITFVKSSTSRRRFIVQLSLGVARQLLEQEKFAEAQVVMQFTQEHFADIVLPNLPVPEQQTSHAQRLRKERENMELLDRLIPT